MAERAILLESDSRFVEIRGEFVKLLSSSGETSELPDENFQRPGGKLGRVSEMSALACEDRRRPGEVSVRNWESFS